MGVAFATIREIINSAGIAFGIDTPTALAYDEAVIYTASVFAVPVRASADLCPLAAHRFDGSHINNSSCHSC